MMLRSFGKTLVIKKREFDEFNLLNYIELHWGADE